MVCIVAAVIELARQGKAPAGEWMKLARAAGIIGRKSKAAC
jgi:hypothetical protein